VCSVCMQCYMRNITIAIISIPHNLVNTLKTIVAFLNDYGVFAVARDAIRGGGGGGGAENKADRWNSDAKAAVVVKADIDSEFELWRRKATKRVAGVKSDVMFLHLVLALDYLEIPFLVELCRKRLVHALEAASSPRDIRRAFSTHIEPEFTSQEAEEVAREVELLFPLPYPDEQLDAKRSRRAESMVGVANAHTPTPVSGAVGEPDGAVDCDGKNLNGEAEQRPHQDLSYSLILEELANDESLEHKHEPNEPSAPSFSSPSNDINHKGGKNHNSSPSPFPSSPPSLYGQPESPSRIFSELDFERTDAPDVVMSNPSQQGIKSFPPSDNELSSAKEDDLRLHSDPEPESDDWETVHSPPVTAQAHNARRLPDRNHVHGKNVPVVLYQLRARKTIAPVADESVVACFDCGEAFSLMLLKKHHCRVCGRIFCFKCAGNHTKLPDYYRNVLLVPNSLTAGLMSYVTNGFDNSVQRVCNECYNEFLSRRDACCRALEVLGLSIMHLLRFGLVCHRWRKAAIIQLSLLRELQYARPTQPFSISDRRALYSNAQLFAGHSSWLVQLIKSVDWSDAKQSAKTMVILRSERRVAPCSWLLCSRLCQHQLRPGDALEFLGPRRPYMPTEEGYSHGVREYALECLNRASLEELKCYLPLLVHNMRYEVEGSGSGSGERMQDSYSFNMVGCFLIRNALVDVEFRYMLYWELSLRALDSTDAFQGLKRRYAVVKDELLSAICQSVGIWEVRRLSNAHWVIHAMEQFQHARVPENTGILVHRQDSNVGADLRKQTSTQPDLLLAEQRLRSAQANDAPKKAFSARLEQLIKAQMGSISLPIDPRFQVSRFDIDNIVTKDSNTSPIVLPCIGSYVSDPQNDARGPGEPWTEAQQQQQQQAAHEEVYKVLYKPEDIRVDQIILSVIRAMDLIVRERLDLDLKVMTYRVLPVSPGGGIIEFIQV
jgi:hypothetical protein